MNQKSIATIGIWNLYADEKRQGVYHIEGFDKRINGPIVIPFAYVTIDNARLAKTFGQPIIVAQQNVSQLSKKAYSRFLAIMKNKM